MAKVIPLPLGGLATEIGNLQDQLQEQEAKRASSTKVATYPSYTINSINSYVQPTGWTPLNVTIFTFTGMLVVWGYEIPNITYSGSYFINTELLLDSSVIQTNSSVTPNQSNPTVIQGFAIIPDGVTTGMTSPLVLGSTHSLSLQVESQTGFSTVVPFQFTNAFISAWVY